MTKSNQLTRFIRDKSGQFAIMFAIAIIPILAGVGLAIDYSAATQSNTRLRDATDAAAIYAATEYRKNGVLPSEADVIKFVSTNYNAESGEKEPVIKSLKLIGGKIELKTEVKRPLAIMGFFGNSDTKIAGSTTINVSNDVELEIALVLDTTASMAAFSGSSSTDLEPVSTDPNPPARHFPAFVPNVTRIEALKYSAKRFTDSVFENDGGLGKTRVAIVPFADYVNVGTDKRGASWLTVPDDSAATGTTCYKNTPVISTSNCRQEFYYHDGANIPTTVCDYVYGPEEDVCYPSGASTWFGCVGSRAQPLNIRDTSPTTKFTGIMDIWCAQPIQPLTSDKATALTTVNNLWPSGATYIPEGVMWGLRVLSTTVPYTEVKTETSGKKVNKIMILMTDGDNQAVANLPSLPTHRGIDEAEADYAANRAQTDGWTLAACAEAKKEKIELYTIAFGKDVSAKAKSVVKSCATDAAHYFEADDAAALNAAFQSIAAKLGGLYISG